jgi:hypothetical protein
MWYPLKIKRSHGGTKDTETTEEFKLYILPVSSVPSVSSVRALNFYGIIADWISLHWPRRPRSFCQARAM